MSLKNNFYWLDYNWLLETIQKYINKEKIKVRLYEKEVINDVNMDFFNLIDFDINILDLTEVKQNSSLTKCQLDILRKINIINNNVNNANRLKIIKCIQSLDISECDGSKRILIKSKEKT